MSKIKMTLGSMLLVSFLTGCSASSNETKNQNAANTIPETSTISSTGVVKVTAQEVSVQKEKPTQAVVKLTIDPGYHINANPPTFPYLKATELELPVDQAFSADFFVYPDPIKKKFAFAEQELAVYEGEVLIKVQLKSNKSAKSGQQKIGARLRVQACDDKVCYAPGVIDFAIPVNVK